MDQLQPTKQPGFPNARGDYEETRGYVLDSGRTWQDYLAILMRHRWTVITVFLAIVVTVTLYTFAATPQYKATTQILIDREGSRLRDLGELAPQQSNSEEFYQTQYRLLESRALAKKVMQKLKLQEHPSFQPIFKALPPDPEPVEVQQAEEVLVTELVKKVEVTPIKNSRLVEVSVTDPDPRFAAEVANALAKGYIEQSLDIRFAASREAASWLHEQLKDARKKLEESEDRLNEYKKENNIIVSEDKETITAQKLEQLNRELVVAQTKRLEAESRYKQVAQGRPPTEVLTSPVIQTLKGQEAQIHAEQSEMSRKYGGKHPRIQRVNEQLAAIRQSIGAETARIAQSIKDQFQIAREQEKNLMGALDTAKSETQIMGDKAIQYQMLLRDVQTNRALHENMLKSLKETTATQNIPATHIRITNPATPPSIPASPKKVRNILIGMLLGLTLGVGVALLLENLDNTLKSPQDVEDWLQVPNLALIPHLKLAGQGNGQKAPALIIHHDSRSLGSEAYRTLRTSITLSTPGHSPHTILVTSSQPMEGKTVTSSNLAAAMAKTEDKVLLVDADLRRPSVHQVLEVDQEPGLSNFLVGEIDYIPAVETLVPHLFVVPSGPIPPNPAELLGSERMREFLRQAREQFDRVIVDSPPIMSVTDAAILSTMVEGVLHVVKAETVTRRTTKEALKSIMEVQGRVLGAVLNDVPSGRNGYYYNYYHYRYQSYYLSDNADHQSGKPTSFRKEKETGPWAWIKDRLNFPKHKDV